MTKFAVFLLGFSASLMLLSFFSMADTLSKIIQENRIIYLPVDKDQYTRIVVRRKHLWADALSQFKNLNERKYVRVTFVGEPAVDEGGPLREFFHLLLYEIAKKNMLFSGDDDKRVPRHCIMELEKKTYFIVGKMFALSLMHGGPAPTFLARSIINYIMHGSAEADVLDVPDKSVQHLLLKV